MKTCKHKNTVVNSSDVAYWIECLRCHEQWDEAGYCNMREKQNQLKPKFVKTFKKRLYTNDPDNINGIRI